MLSGSMVSLYSLPAGNISLLSYFLCRSEEKHALITKTEAREVVTQSLVC